MVRHNEAPRDSIDSTLPQMSDLAPADGSLFRPSHARRPSNPNVFADDYSIDSIDAPLFSNHPRTQSFSSFDSNSTIEPRHYDASRPAHENSTRANLLTQQRNSPSLASVPQRDESLTLGRIASHHSEGSSASNEGINVNPFADQPTSSFADSPRPSSIRKGIAPLNRQSTVSTTSTRSGYTPVPRPMSPYRGATGPSHPYAMYPQVGVSRSPSVATVSTIRQSDSPTRGRNAPQHPYSMYPQNIDYEEDLGDQPIPVGFPRGMEPQGTTTQADDVGDIIGPDGHLEQLPPYSRYPDGVIRPTTGRGPASIASDVRGRWERYRDEPRNRPDASSGTLVNTDSSEPLRSPIAPSERSSTLVAPAPLDEKRRRRGQQKCCGAPVWLVVMLSMAMLICALLGGAIGGVLGEKAATHRAELAASAHPSPASVVTVTYTSDVSPYTATPTGFAALPTGNYQVPWTITNVSKFCVGTSNQMPSWSCQIMDPLAIEIQGSILSGSITIEQPNIKNGHFGYGAQLPYDINPPKQHLSIMIDKEDPQLGPALFFQTFFNKLVIVQDSPEMQSKRSLSERGTSGTGFGQGQTEDTKYLKPWFCWWNETQIETFIYLNQTQDGAGTAIMSPAAQPASITTGPSATSTAGSPKRDFSVRDSIADKYPRKVKVKENRVNPTAPQAYCQQMQVNADNSITPIAGQRFNINETLPTGPHDESKPPPCYCQWMT